MTAAAIIAAIESAIEIANVAIRLGKDAMPFVLAIRDMLSGKTDVTQADLDALEARIDALSVELQLPLDDEPAPKL